MFVETNAVLMYMPLHDFEANLLVVFVNANTGIWADSFKQIVQFFIKSTCLSRAYPVFFIWTHCYIVI